MNRDETMTVRALRDRLDGITKNGGGDMPVRTDVELPVKRVATRDIPVKHDRLIQIRWAVLFSV